jgi:branched-chain amino acid transport system permease protein
MDAFIVQLLAGLAGATSLFLLASGLTVIFGVTRIVNFAHGSLFMLGAYAGWTILTALPRGPGWFVAGIFATGLTIAAFGVLIELTLLRRIYHAPELLQLLATFGVVLVIQDLTLKIWGPSDLTLSRPPWLRGFVSVGDSRVPVYDLALIGIGPLVFGGLHLLFRHTHWGTLVRAATQDREMVAALGVDQRRLFTSVFALGGFLAGAGGALTLPDGSANLQIDLSSIVDAFVVVVVGGLGSLTGAWLASLMIGLLQAFGVLLLPKATLVLTFAIMAVVLILRPNGLLGSPTERVRSKGGDFALIRPAAPALRWLGMAVVLAAVAAPAFASPFMLSVLTEMLIAVLFAASLHVIMGPGGMASFGQAAWFGIGAYAAALAVKSLSMPMVGSLFIAAMASAFAALLVGLFLVRLSGVYLAMLTLAFAQIVWAVAFQAVNLTGGDNGTLGVWPPPWAATPRVFYWLTLALCIGGTWFLRHALYTPFGYALRAARDAELRAASIGLHAPALRLVALTLSGAAAGLAGALTTFDKGSAFPTYISIGGSVDALIMVLLGGLQTMAGPVIGAVVYTGLFDGLLLITSLWRLVLGVAIILLVLGFPEGIAGTAQRIWQKGRQA